MADCRFFFTGIAYDRKTNVCKLVLWLATRRDKAFDGRLTSFVYNFRVGTWKKIPELNITRPIYYFTTVTPFLLQERFLCWFTDSTVVLVFDVEEDSWTESISFPSTLLDEEQFVCIAEHKRQLCVIRKSFGEDGNMIWELWKLDGKESVWKVAELIPLPPIPPPVDVSYIYISGHRDFLSLRHWNIERRHKLWVYDISHHDWQCVGEFHCCLEASLFRLTA
jgi:hypothetical protein